MRVSRIVLFTTAWMSCSGVAMARRWERGLLVGAHSGACLGGDVKPRAESCDTAPTLTLVRLPGDRLLIRDDRRDACLFSNRDGRFGWYACTPEYEDQQWSLEAANDSGAMMVRAVHSGRCLFSNRDGRFGAWDCHPEFGDQYWRLETRAIAPTPAPPAGPATGAALFSGDWIWSDGTVSAIHADGTIALPDDGAATWRQIGPRDIEIDWGSGRLDRVHLSRDGRELTGVGSWNGGQQRVSARRPRADDAPPAVAVPRDCGADSDDPGCQETRNGAYAMDASVWSPLLASVQATSSEISKRDMIAAATASSYLTARQLMLLLDLFRSEVTKLEVVQRVVGHVIDPLRAIAYGPRMRSTINRERLIQLLSAPDPAPPPVSPPAPHDPPPHKRGPERCAPMPACGLYCPSGRFAHDKNGCPQCACEPDPLHP